MKIDNLEIEPVHVDHSVPGAYGFLIHTSNGSVIYTGDLRLHGAKGEMTTDFVSKAKEAEPVAVVSEATNMTGASISSEKEVEGKLSSIVDQTDGIVLAEFAYADQDRLNSFHRVAERNNRCLAASLKQAYLLNALRKDKGLSVPDLGDKNVLIFRKSKKREDAWEKEIAKQYPDKIVDVFEVSKQQCKVVLAMSFYDLEELVDIHPEPGSCYVVSALEPFNEEMETDEGKLVNWLAHYGLPQYHAHVSGHIIPLQLRSVLAKIHAAKVYPVHTERPELFRKFMRNIKSAKRSQSKKGKNTESRRRTIVTVNIDGEFLVDVVSSDS